MPYKIQRRGGKWFVVKKDTNKIVSKPMDTSMMANKRMKAMMAKEGMSKKDMPMMK